MSAQREASELVNLLIAASRTPHGVIVSTPCPQRLRQSLYPLMSQTGLRAKLRIPATPERLWIVTSAGGPE